MATFNCPKCGAPVQYDAKDKFVKCNYCSTDIYIDKSGAGFFYILSFALSENDALGTFRRWAGGSTKAKDLDKLAQVAGMKKQFFPVYLFKRDVDGTDQVFVEPAGSTTLPGLHSLKVPAGDLKVFDNKFDTAGVEMVKPDIEMLPYLNQLPGKAKEQSLVYFPIYILDYVFDGKKWKAIISATTGEIFSGDYPKRSSSAYILLAAAGFVAFLAEGIVATQYLVLGLGLMGATVLGIFLASFMIAKRM